jgi:sugar phosphate isomerase/epimerase
MDRRELLLAGGAAVTGSLIGQAALAQAPAAAKPLALSAYSRTFHWLRTPAEVAAAIREVGNKAVDLTVRSGGGHVDPAKVATELPLWVRGLRAGGVDVSMIAPTITEAEDPYAEATLDAAAQLGIRHYWWGTWRYDETKPYWPQLDALKPKVEKIARLNEKYGMKGIAHPRNGAGSVSAAFYDLYYLLKDFDPRWVGFQYDTQHLLQAYDGGWVQQLRMGGSYIGGFVWKDMVIERVDAPNPDAEWLAAHPRPAAGPGAPGFGTGGGPGGPGAPPRRAAGPATKTRIRHVPIGQGMVNLALIAQTLKEIGFNGPMEVEPEWPQLGGPDQGALTLQLSRAEVIALLRRDRLAMEAILAAAGLI